MSKPLNILSGSSLSFAYLNKRKIGYTVTKPDKAYIVFGGFDVAFNDKTYTVKVRYPCRCCLEIDLDFYISQCESKPPLVFRDRFYTCPCCGAKIEEI